MKSTTDLHSVNEDVSMTTDDVNKAYQDFNQKRLDWEKLNKEAQIDYRNNDKYIAATAAWDSCVEARDYWKKLDTDLYRFYRHGGNNA